MEKKGVRPDRKVGHITITGESDRDIKAKLVKLDIEDERGILDDL